MPSASASASATVVVLHVVLAERNSTYMYCWYYHHHHHQYKFRVLSSLLSQEHKLEPYDLGNGTWGLCRYMDRADGWVLD